MSRPPIIQGVAPSRTETSGDEGAYAEAVRRCMKAGEKIVDYGVAHTGLGIAPPDGFVHVVPPMDGFEHWVADLSARVPGGLTIGELQRRLAPHNQWLPIDADDDMTVAEAITHDACGPLRLSHGTFRDLLLGMTYVDGAGQLITVGGRTIKNVAGYDVTRMMVGSLNTLGLVASANLRLEAIPEYCLRLTIAGQSPESLDPLTTSLLTSDATPGTIEWSCRGEKPVLHLTFTGTRQSCEAQHESLRVWWTQQMPRTGTISPSACGPDDEAHERQNARAWRRSIAAHVKIVAPPAETGRTMSLLHALKPDFLDAQPAHGVIHVGSDWTAERACDADGRILEAILANGGIRTWYKRPDNTARIEPFAPVQPDWPMLARIKKAMDPNDTFNPGRFPYDDSPPS